MHGDYVITGGPCCGKSTLIKALEKRGFTIVPEAATEVIEEQLHINGTALPTKDNYRFQVLLAERQIPRENRGDMKPRFLDRSIVDSAGYCTYQGTPLPSIVLEGIHAARYSAVFFLEQLPFYENNKVRWENAEQARQLSGFIYGSYVKHGFIPIKIPATPLEHRIEEVLRHVKRT